MKTSAIDAGAFRLPEHISFTIAFGALFRAELEANEPTLFEWDDYKLFNTIENVLDKLGINYPEDTGEWKVELTSIALDEFECTAGFALGTDRSDDSDEEE